MNAPFKSHSAVAGGRLEARLDAKLSHEAMAAATAFVAGAPSGSHLQRPDWDRLCPPPRRHRYMALRILVGEQLVAYGNARFSGPAPGLTVASLRRGPVTATLDDLDAATPSILRTLRSAGAATVVLNPRWEDTAADDAEAILRRHGATRAPDAEQALHLATDLVALGRSEVDLLASFKQRARRQIRAAEARGLVVRPAASIEEARRYGALLQRFHASRGLGLESTPPIETQFAMTREKGAFLLAWRGEELIGGHTVIADRSRAFWLTLAAEDARRDLPYGYALVWAAIRAANAQGLSDYDMAGAPLDFGAVDEGAQTRDQFKTAFAPRRVRLTPAMVFPVRPLAHAFTAVMRHQRRLLKARGR